MPIPDFTPHGFLPQGVHDCTLTEIESRFCLNPHRCEVFGGLTGFIVAELQPLDLTGFPLYVDGSFSTSKEFPKDVDIVLDVNGCTKSQYISAMGLWMTRERFAEPYFVDFWVKHPTVDSDLSAYFGYIRAEQCRELGIPDTTRKGMMRIQL